jgi:hypothetical protein
MVSLLVPVGLWLNPRTTSAGSSEKRLKKLKGAALCKPSLFIDVTKATGLGTTRADKNL